MVKNCILRRSSCFRLGEDFCVVIFLGDAVVPLYDSAKRYSGSEKLLARLTRSRASLHASRFFGLHSSLPISAHLGNIVRVEQLSRKSTVKCPSMMVKI
jgi:hypothetical protein